MLRLACPFNFYCNNTRLSHIHLSLCRNWQSPQLQSRIIVPNAAEPYRGTDMVEAVPDSLKWLAYRSYSAVRYFVERTLLRTLNQYDAVYAFPDISIPTLRRIKKSGHPVILERINGFTGKTRGILDSAYAALGIEQANPIDDRMVMTERIGVGLADFLFCPSPTVEKSLLEAGVPPEKLILTSYGWSPERFHESLHAKMPRPSVTFLFAGDVCVRKGAHVLLRAWEQARINGRLILCGPMEAAIATRFRAVLDRPDVEHIPYQPMMERTYPAADVFVLPSLEESGPLVTYEAMAHGLPVVVSPMGAGSIVRPGIDGVVLPPEDDEGWIAELRRFAGSPELRESYGSLARTRAQEFTWDKVAKRRAETMLQRLVPAGPRPSRSV